MSYHEENGQVVLTMSRDDYDALLIRLGIAAGYVVLCGNPVWACVSRASREGGAMSGHIEQLGGSWLVKVDGEIVAIRPDRESAEECLLQIYLFRKAESVEP